MQRDMVGYIRHGLGDAYAVAQFVEKPDVDITLTNNKTQNILGMLRL